jgi:iron complex outermembrane receptor protein
MKKPFIQRVLTFTAIAIFIFNSVYSQTDTARLNAYEDLSLKDLLNVKIVSVSKESELLFDAPLSASVVTREEIRRTGCTSVMEALRLVPGMIVREQSNGNYDIHLRGMDNVPPNSAFDLTSNTTTLVMVDNRPIYSYLKGGTFWETFPVDINDVEKIEVVRGPAAALYGPNAVNGVINIITRQLNKDGLYLVANSQQGSYKTTINNASVGYKFNNKWSAVASGNYQRRNRTQTSYFEFSRNRRVEPSDYFIRLTGDTARNVHERYPNPDLAMEKYAGNVFLNFTPAENIKINLSTGAQHSFGQRVSTENEVTPLSTVSSDSRYADLRINIDKLSAQFSYNNGTQVTDHDGVNKYDFYTLDGNIEYNYTIGNLSIKPGLSYRSAVYDDTKYSDLVSKTGIFNAKGTITTQTASIRVEYKLLSDKLRLVAGVRADKFNYPDTTYISSEFAATYKLNKKNLIRAVYSTSPRSSSIFDTYVDQTIAYFPVGIKQFVRISLEGDKNLKLLTANMFEIGYRSKLTDNLDFDVELFDINAKNYLNLISDAPYMKLNGTDTVTVLPIRSLNLPMTLHQQGVTVSLTYSSAKFQLKPFITVQQTKMKNYAPFNNTPESIPGLITTADPVHENIYSAMGVVTKLKSTPSVFGGASVNYSITSKLNTNLNAYYYSNQTYYHFSNIIYRDGIRGIDNINAKLILNASVSYEAVKGLHIFCSGKNILNNKTREFFRTDDVPAMFLAGVNYQF